ncbi:hypothetical protein [Nocardia salmonicida]|uniref:hypothetical protein n=1 Tax=Nocardia salmonicida TaxID=53431 RepID=UPI0033D0FEE8
MAYYAPTPGAPVRRKFTTDTSFRAFFWVFAAVTLVVLFAAMWCSSLPNSHNLGVFVWPVAFVLVPVCTIVAFVTALGLETTMAVRVMAVAIALAVPGAFIFALTSDIVELRWRIAESAFDRTAANASTGSRTDGGWIAGYPVRDIWRDAHANVYVTISDTGITSSDSGFAKLPAYADRAYTEYQCYIHLRGDWYYWLPKSGRCEA